MNSKIKIVHILCHPPHPIISEYKKPQDYFGPIGKGDYINIEKPPYWIGFFTGDHHVVAAKELKNLTDEFVIECWRPYGSKIKDIYSKEVEGITHRVFPSWSINIPQIGSGNFSPKLLKYLLAYIKKNKVILNISVGHAWFHIWLLFKLRKVKKNIPIVVLHRSSGFKKFNYSQLHPVVKLFKWYYFLEHFFDVMSLKYVDHYFSGSIIETSYLKTKKNINSSFFMEGVDFNFFKPAVDKKEIRKELGLPQDKIIMIVTGNFRSSDYGYHHLIECYKKIKEKHNDLFLVMVGGYKHEDLYEKGINAGATMIERVTKEKLLKYYQASDFYGQPSLHFSFINFGGFGSAMIEALACGLPILSQNIIHFPGTSEERDKIGMDMPTVQALMENMIYLKDNHIKFSECREIAYKYFDIEKTKLVLLNYYRKLTVQYFKDPLKSTNT
jgi:glycosyltransferase involved in cell wall biosynthesis